MAQPTRLFASIAGYVGRPDATGASGVFRRSVVAGGAWEHVLEEVAAHYVLIHPTEPNVVLAGTTDGVYRSTDHGATFQRAGFPEAGRQVWSLMVDESDPRCVYAGASPVGVFLSEDAGATWQALPDPGVPARVSGPFESRVMRMAQRPGEPETVYAALEFGGAMVSHDRSERSQRRWLALPVRGGASWRSPRHHHSSMTSVPCMVELWPGIMHPYR